MKLALPCTLLLLPWLAAQDKQDKIDPENDRFRIGLALASGTVQLDQGPPLDDETRASLFRLQFEYVGANDFGGGVRIDSLVSDDDLFQNVTAATEERNVDFFAHFTWRLGSDRFRMPVRVGLLANRLEVEAKSTDSESDFTSLGPYVEVAPELTLLLAGRAHWSVYAEVGIGWAVTQIELDNSQDFDSTTLFVGGEIGTRLRLGMFEIGLAYIERFQSMTRSDTENGSSVAPLDTSFHGGLVSFALRF